MTASPKIRVLFGAKGDWEPPIRARLDTERYDCLFADLQSVNLTDFDLVVPLTLKDYGSLEKAGDAVRGRALFPRADVVSLCHDKLRFNRLIAASPFGSVIPPLFEGVPPPLPFIVKRREDVFGANAHLVLTEEDRTRLREIMRRPAYFMQTYVPGDREFATHILVRRGQPIYHLNVTYEMPDSPYIKSKATAPRRITSNNETHKLPLFLDILRYIGFENGTCCFNYKLSAENIYLLEINPRFGGSLNLDINGYLLAYATAVAM